MSIVDRTQDIVVPYSLDKTFEAMEKILPKLKDFKIDRVDDKIKIIYLKTMGTVLIVLR